MEFFNERSIMFKAFFKVSSVDFVLFSWQGRLRRTTTTTMLMKRMTSSTMISQPSSPSGDGERHYANPTVWIGVLPETLTGAVAHESSKDICTFFDSLQVQYIDIAYRESLYKTLPQHGPAFFPLGDPLKRCHRQCLCSSQSSHLWS